MTHKPRRSAWYTYLISVRISQQPTFRERAIGHTDRGLLNSHTRHYRPVHAKTTLLSLGFSMISTLLAQARLLHSKMPQLSFCSQTLAKDFLLWMATTVIGAWPLSLIPSYPIKHNVRYIAIPQKQLDSMEQWRCTRPGSRSEQQQHDRGRQLSRPTYPRALGRPPERDGSPLGWAWGYRDGKCTRRCIIRRC